MKRAHLIIKVFELSVEISLVISTLFCIIALKLGAPKNTLDQIDRDKCYTIAKEIYYNKNYDIYPGYIVEIGTDSNIIKVSLNDSWEIEEKMVYTFDNDTVDVKHEVDYNMRLKHVLRDSIALFLGMVIVFTIIVTIICGSGNYKDTDAVIEQNVNKEE